MEEVEGDWWLLRSFSGYSRSYPDIWLPIFLFIKKKLAERFILRILFHKYVTSSFPDPFIVISPLLGFEAGLILKTFSSRCKQNSWLQ